MTSVNPHPRDSFATPTTSLGSTSLGYSPQHNAPEVDCEFRNDEISSSEPVIKLDGFESPGSPSEVNEAHEHQTPIRNKAANAERPLRSSNDEDNSALKRLQRSTEALLAYTRALEEGQGSRKIPRGKNVENREQLPADEHLESDRTFTSLPARQPAQPGEENYVNFDEDTFCLNGKGLLETVATFGLQVFREPQVFVKHYGALATEMLDIAKGKSHLQPDRGDRRFRDAVWNENPIYRCVLQTYLAWAKELDGLVQDLRFNEEADRRRAQFLLDQLVAAAAPSNSPLNPVAVKRAFQTGGLSVVAGLRNLFEDIADNHGMPRQTDRNSFEVGKDLATTPGAVVFRSEVLELIQYGCQSETVFRCPILFIPPQINKFYIFDLAEKNSLVRHLLKEGHQVFILSWKNPNKANAAWDLNTYIAHADQAVSALSDITGCSELHLVSACAGGLTATALQAYYHSLGEQAANDHMAKPKPKIIGHSMLVTALSAREHPTLNLFINKRAVAYSVARSARRGVMNGRELAHVFAWLRPVDLVWNFWVNNCLLGKEPPTMDVLFWDNDSTRLPAGLHRDFTDIVVHDRYAQPRSFQVLGQEIDLTNLDSDFYFLGGEEDYLMPWKNCYRNLALLPKGKCHYVLSDSGHIQSVLRPPGIGNIAYYTNDVLPERADEWLAGAKKNSGSWWQHWSAWLSERGGETKAAPEQLGNERYPPLCAAPGTYVLES